MTRRAFITGISGQDGSYLADLLVQEGYQVHGLVRRSPSERLERIEHIGDKLTLHRGDLLDEGSLRTALRAAQPDEIYNLAAVTEAPAAWASPALAAEVNGVGVTRLLDAARDVCPEARVLQGSCSEMFGRVTEAPQTERTAPHPSSPGAAAKAYGHVMTGIYRETHGIHAAGAILFSHTSPRRGLQFVTRRITWHAAAIRLGLSVRLRLGDLEAERDWGFALDYVRAIWLVLQQERPEDFVIASGTAHSVREWLELAFDHAGVSVQEHVETDPGLRRPGEAEHLVGDASKAKQVLGWEPDVGFEELVRLMVEADYALLRHELGTRA